MPTKHHDENKDKVGNKKMGRSGQSDRRHNAMKEAQEANRKKKEAAAAEKKAKKK
ncbi:MAG: hypothetical protein AAGD12_09115 [Pseudomonadota bacterium]